MLTAPELEARRWDGYRGMVAPQLRGSWSWPGASLQAGYETRLRAAADAMLCRLPFWYLVRDHHSPHKDSFVHQQPVLETRLRAAADAMLCRLPSWYSVSNHQFAY